MSLSRKGYILSAAILLLFVILTVLALSVPVPADPVRLFVRLSALYGFAALSIAVMMTPFLREVYRLFGRPFLSVHHTFAAFGLAAVTLHPVVFALSVANPLVFLPSLSSWMGFWINAGRPALILMYIALVGVLLRRRIPRYWRPLHALMVVALTLAIIHANLIGTDFESIGIRVLLNGLFIAVLTAFLLKRWRTYQATRKQPAKL